MVLGGEDYGVLFSEYLYILSILCKSWSTIICSLICINPSDAVTSIFQVNEVIIVVADALVPCVTRSSSGMELTVSNESILVSFGSEFPWISTTYDIPVSSNDVKYKCTCMFSLSEQFNTKWISMFIYMYVFLHSMYHNSPVFQQFDGILSKGPYPPCLRMDTLDICHPLLSIKSCHTFLYWLPLIHSSSVTTVTQCLHCQARVRRSAGHELIFTASPLVIVLEFQYSIYIASLFVVAIYDWRSVYYSILFLQKIHKRHSMACLWRWGMDGSLCIHNVIFMLHLPL